MREQELLEKIAYLSQELSEVSDNISIAEFELKTIRSRNKESERRAAIREFESMCDGIDLKIGYYTPFLAVGDEYYHFLPRPQHHHMSTPYRFKSANSCNKAIDTLGEDKLKLIYQINC